ncbi:hypothetical protein Mgra_00001632 [Meloidogyne graminicola]|uniref:T-cell activation inhibitor, mitochondrial n=1 Tax=Meloidogyne graminicola TaxID=189291 RepID=A0A8S9ZYI0_9BILA|nr:hypothetical protein Mgra_00001632 [Meloidogyne graminicola]
MVRRRLQEGQDFTKKDINKTESRNNSKDEQVRELLDEDKKHENFAQELLKLTYSLKQNFTIAGSVLKEDNAALNLFLTKMCPNTLFFLRKFPNVCMTQQCLFSAKDAAVALRPFYFAVHPDRFAQDPEIQNRNERALQVFNGYINNLFPEPVNQIPVKVEFIVRDNCSNFKSIQIFLSGADPEQIIKLALERCELSTDNLPIRDKYQHKTTVEIKSSPPQNFAPGLDEIWKNLQENERIRQKQLSNNRELALQRRDGHKRMVEMIDDSIDDIKRKTGVTQILWSINWELTFMRRCLINVLEMINHSDINSKDFIIYSLNDRKLIFGRGSHICCDGSLQFGADDAIGAWQKICIESAKFQTFEVQNLQRLGQRVVELFGGINLLIQPYDGLLQTIKNIKLFIGRVCSQPPKEITAINSLLKKDQQVEIKNGYSELALVNGILQVPCNVDIQSMKQFIMNNDTSKDEKTRKEFFEQKNFLESVKNSAISHLELNSLSWDEDLNFTRLLIVLRKLAKFEKEHVHHFSDLEIHLGSGPKIFVLASGKISLPIEMIENFQI